MQDFRAAIGLTDWQKAADSAEAALMLIDPFEDRLRQFNDAAQEMTGLLGYQLQEGPAHSLFPGQISELKGLTLECLAVGRCWSMDFELFNAKGPPRPVELFASRFESEGRQHIFMMCLDQRATARRRAMREVERAYQGDRSEANRIDQVFRQLEKGNQLILDAAGEGIYGVDASGKTTFLNPAAERMLGWRANELVGRVAHSVFHHSHADGTGYAIKACPIYAAFRDGVVRRVDTEVFWRKDGSCFPVEYTSTPIKESGQLLGAVVVFRDVSAQREAQEQLVKALDEVGALKRRLQLENAYLQDELRVVSNHKEIVGDSQAVRGIVRQIEMVAPSDATVLITGESGTGKELIARAIHDASARRERPLIRVNCASIPRDLFESEFFGHAKGAFTGAVGERIGRFELADGGTIFLDEVGELPLEHQAKLLRILQEGQFERVGDPRTRSVDVRVIAATNRDLRSEVNDKRFREDLFFRLNVFPIASPPLRDRLDDIPLLARLFVKRAMKRANKSGLQISLADVERLQGYNWPGNIRELENVIERAVITAIDGRLRLHVPQMHILSGDETVVTQPQSGGDFAHSAPANEKPRNVADKREVLTDDARKQLERDSVIAALKQCKGRVSGPGGAAEILGLKPTTLYSRLKRLAIDARTFKS